MTEISRRGTEIPLEREQHGQRSPLPWDRDPLDKEPPPLQ